MASADVFLTQHCCRKVLHNFEQASNSYNDVCNKFIAMIHVSIKNRRV